MNKVTKQGTQKDWKTALLLAAVPALINSLGRFASGIIDKKYPSAKAKAQIRAAKAQAEERKAAAEKHAAEAEIARARKEIILQQEEAKLEELKARAREAQAKADAAEMIKNSRMMQENPDDENEDLEDNKVNLSWEERNALEFEMPHLPTFLEEIIKGTPQGFQPAMLLHLITMLGAYCFSRVRAKYSDGKFHAPNLMTIIEGMAGSGKDKFNMVFQELFQTSDISYYQNIDIDISAQELKSVISKNSGLHAYCMVPEICQAMDSLKASNLKSGIKYKTLREVFDSHKDDQLFLNLTMTGTPQDVQKFISKQTEGGTAMRICWSVIPELGEAIPKLVLPADDKIEGMKLQICNWKAKYCFDEKGIKSITEIDLEYLHKSLDSWRTRQLELSKQPSSDKEEARGGEVRARISAIAFHCAIVIHMLYGCPGEDDNKTRTAVKKLVIYIADYLMDRYIHKFGTDWIAQRENFRQRENVEIKINTQSSVPTKTEELTPEIIEEAKKIYVPNKVGYRSVAKHLTEKFGIEVSHTTIAQLLKTN